MRSAPLTNKRCSWASADSPLLVEYHDREWGVPAHNDHKHFEVLVLSGAQAGLSWSLVLKKREGYRRAFDKFDPEKVARYSERRIQKLTSDLEIIRKGIGDINGVLSIGRRAAAPPTGAPPTTR